MAVKNLGKVTITPKGEFNELTTYQKLDVVTYLGSSYMALQESTGNLPTDETYFQKLAEKGVDGEPGKDGVNGVDGKDGVNGTNGVDGKDGTSISSIVQTTTSTESGGTNVITATLSDGSTSTFNIMNGAKGEQGIQGVQGEAGATGKSAYQIWLDEGNIGTEADFLTSLKGEQGPKGKTGATGPQGEQGVQGIQGPKGDTGETGPQGAIGADGQSATITVGTVTTLDAGSNATVENVGTQTNAIFNFGIPKGKAGENAVDSITSTSINSIQVVDSLPETETEGVLYLVKESSEEVSAVSLIEEDSSISTEEELSNSEEGA